MTVIKSKYRLNKGIIVQKLDGKTTIFDGEESVLYTFNETASFIFSKFKLGWDNYQIVKSLIKKYGINESKAEKDLYELFTDLRSKKIII